MGSQEDGSTQPMDNCSQPTDDDCACDASDDAGCWGRLMPLHEKLAPICTERGTEQTEDSELQTSNRMLPCFVVLKGQPHEEVTFGRCEDVSHSFGKLGLPFESGISKIHFLLERVSRTKRATLGCCFCSIISNVGCPIDQGASFR